MENTAHSRYAVGVGKANSLEQQLRANLAAAREARNAQTQSAQRAADRLALRRYQQMRLKSTHSDLLESKRYAPATQFFLTELYSTEDLTQRDADIERVIKVLVKFLPDNALKTLATALEMDALSERLDGEMASELRAASAGRSALTITEQSYARAYRCVGQFDARQHQINLTEQLGYSLDKLSRLPLLLGLLRMMRLPASAAGVAGLHEFLEAGYSAFKKMNGGGEFIKAIVEREQAEHERLISIDKPN
ncbi:MAG: hypothetical protein EAZ30_01995 [Betaproteobacteria bacterium]|nr:MAG: hypothetical protein EAZ30_01995 [Betaproteobacteria bacterium]